MRYPAVQWLYLSAFHARVRKQFLLDAPNSHNARAELWKCDGILLPEEISALLSVASNCHWCKLPFTSSRTKSLDHLWPLYGGGPNRVENLAVSCRSCNSRKSTKSPIEYLRIIGRYTPEEAGRYERILSLEVPEAGDIEARLKQPMVHYQHHDKQGVWLFLCRDYQHYIAGLHPASQQTGFHFTFERGDRYPWRGLLTEKLEAAEALLRALSPIARIVFWPDFSVEQRKAQKKMRVEKSEKEALRVHH